MSQRRKPESWWKLKRAALERDGGCCFYCGSDEGLLEGDHYVPLSKGGGWELDNIVTACRSCNQRKGSLMPEEWWRVLRGEK